MVKLVKPTEKTLDEFTANALEHLRRLRETGGAEMLTVDGRTEGVLLSPEEYDRLVREIELAETMEGIRKSEAEIARGDVVSVDEAAATIRRAIEGTKAR